MQQWCSRDATRERRDLQFILLLSMGYGNFPPGIALASNLLRQKLMELYMQQAIPKKLFFLIAQNMASPDPTWALFMANEYLDELDPLRTALVLKARTSGKTQPLFEAACAGKKIHEITAQERRTLKGSASNLHRQMRPIPQPRHRRTMVRTLQERRLAAHV